MTTQLLFVPLKPFIPSSTSDNEMPASKLVLGKKHYQPKSLKHPQAHTEGVLWHSAVWMAKCQPGDSEHSPHQLMVTDAVTGTGQYGSLNCCSWDSDQMEKKGSPRYILHPTIGEAG